MTPTNESTSVSNVKDSTKKSEVEGLLKRTEVSPPIVPTKPKKETRGRKKKKVKPTYTKNKYSTHPVAQVINKATCGIINKSALKDSTDKLKPQEIELGEATVYLLDYYSDMLMHPAMIVVSAGVGVGIATLAKMQKIPRKTDEKERAKQRGKVT